MVFKKMSNGHELSIHVDVEALNAEMDKRIQEYSELIGKEITNDEDGWDTIYEYALQSVYGDPESDYCSVDSILKDCNEFKELITNICKNPDQLWDKVSFKKNGTFKLNAKPTLKEAINGNYWEDSYGWHTLILRMVPHSDTEIHVEFDTIVLHY